LLIAQHPLHDHPCLPTLEPLCMITTLFIFAWVRNVGQDASRDFAIL
jgi:hypothetical protein